MAKKKNVCTLLLAVCTILLVVIMHASFALCAEIPTKTLRIGAILSLSGKGAGLGVPFQRTLILQAEQYNKTGGITVGGQKYKIELIIEDDKYTGDGGKIAAEKLIYRDNVKFIMGPTISPGGLIVNSIAEEKKVIRFLDGVSPKQISPENTYAFRPYMTATERAPTKYRWVKENLRGVKRIGVLGVDDETGQSHYTGIKKNAEANGLEVGPPIYYPRGTGDFFPTTTKLLDMKPDFIDYGGAAVGELGLQVKAARQLGFKGYLSLAYPQDASELCAIAGKENAEGFLFFDALVADALPSTKAVKDAYVARWNDWDPYVLKWWVYLPILIDTIKATGTVEDTTKIRDTMEKMEFDSPVGHLRWSGKKTYGIAHQIFTPFGVAKVQNCNLISLGVIPAIKVMEAAGEK
jgi:branched-chain amino acid transport system substrate-binding protein